jgi:hypothetical protein
VVEAGFAAAVFTVLLLTVLIVPIALLGQALIGGFQYLAAHLHDGNPEGPKATSKHRNLAHHRQAFERAMEPGFY